MIMKWDIRIVSLTSSKKLVNAVAEPKRPQKQSIKQLGPIELSANKVIVRVDFNVPMHNGIITDDSRIQAALPTINYLLGNNATVILISHFGRPKEGFCKQYSLAPISDRLAELLGQPVIMAPACTGNEVSQLIENSESQDVIVLENIRFEPEEQANGIGLAQQLAALGDLFVQDSFGTVHRNHASTAGIAQYLPSYAGLLLDKEITILSNAITSPKRPLVAIIGGSKVSSKLHVLVSLLEKVDTLVIGGAMVYTFLKAQGKSVGKSLCEDNQIELAKAFLAQIQTTTTKVIFPVDHRVVTEVSNDAVVSTVSSDNILENHIGVDIGSETVQLIQSELKTAETIIWNGPLGIFEIEQFSTGTKAIAQTLAQSNAVTIIGGGDSAAAIKQAGLSDQMTHISTGGGASLEFLSNRPLPGIDVLADHE